MKKYLDVNGITSLYKIIMGKVDDMLNEKLQLLLTPSTRPLTFEVLENGSFGFSKSGLSYSLDYGTTWTTLSAGGSTPTIPAGSKVLWKGNYKGTSVSDYGSFGSTGKFNVSGNIMSLMYGDDFKDKTDLTGTNYIFCRLFEGCSKLIDVSDLILPATTLAKGCYNGMFKNCSSLTTVPELPAMTLAEDCYAYMFESCTSLKSAPKVLPATTLASYCYYRMFKNCTSLVTAPELPTTTLASNCYFAMFTGCTSLTTVPALPATTLANWCYYYMFQNCTSLTTAPVLPATTLVSGCYSCMFLNCANLNYIKAMFTTTPGISCTESWVSGVSSTGTFVKSVDATWNVTGTSGVPSGWTVETA